MITNFKIFENNEPKFKIGDYVYVRSSSSSGGSGIVRTKESEKIIKVIPMSERPDNNCNRYVLENSPNITVREDYLIPEYEITAKKYNI